MEIQLVQQQVQVQYLLQAGLQVQMYMDYILLAVLSTVKKYSGFYHCI